MKSKLTRKAHYIPAGIPIFAGFSQFADNFNRAILARLIHEKIKICALRSQASD